MSKLYRVNASEGVTRNGNQVHGPNEIGGYSISTDQVWRPGHYESIAAAHLAFELSDEVLQRLQDEANTANGGKDGVLTFDVLMAAMEPGQIAVIRGPLPPTIKGADGTDLIVVARSRRS